MYQYNLLTDPADLINKEAERDVVEPVTLLHN